MTHVLKINEVEVDLVDSFSLKIQLNQASTLDFSLNGYNEYDAMDIVELYEDDVLLFKGRITDTDPNVHTKVTKYYVTEFTAKKMLGTFVAETYENMTFNEIISDICHKSGITNESETFLNSINQYNISYVNALQCIQNIATILNADFYLNDETLYLFKKGSKVYETALNGNYIENLETKKDDTNFGNDIIVLGYEDKNGVKLMAEITNKESIDQYGRFQRVINDDSLKTKEACILRAIIECRDRSVVRTTGKFTMIKDFDIEVGQIVHIIHNDPEVDEQFRIISSTLTFYDENKVVCEYDIDTNVQDVPLLLNELNNRLKNLENKDVDTKVNKFFNGEMTIAVNVVLIDELDNYVGLFDEDLFNYTCFG